MTFDQAPNKVTEYCRAILYNWEYEMEYYITHRMSKYTAHIIKSLAHPELRNAAKLVACSMLKKEEENPGFVDELLLEYAQAVAGGETLIWNDNFD
jgi:hypothetical protein